MIGELIGEWIKGILIDGIMGNLSGLFSTVNTKVGEIASDVGIDTASVEQRHIQYAAIPVGHGDRPHCSGDPCPCDVL